MSELGAGVRVVVADDDADIRALVSIAVKKSGMHMAASVGDGDSAWDAITAHRPDLVVLDVSMPGKSGLELCQLIRADVSLRSTRIMLLSAGATEASQQAGLDAGADEYHVKPFSPKELAVRLADLGNLSRVTA
ncbi:MAG: response regulator [Terrimesophilobacter sp.]